MAPKSSRTRDVAISGLVGQRIGRFRNVLKLSQNEFARRAKVAGGTVSLIEKGTKRMTLEILAKIADGFDVLQLCFLDDSKWTAGPNPTSDALILSEAVLARVVAEGGIEQQRVATLLDWVRTGPYRPTMRTEWLAIASAPAADKAPADTAAADKPPADREAVPRIGDLQRAPAESRAPRVPPTTDPLLRRPALIRGGRGGDSPA